MWTIWIFNIVPNGRSAAIFTTHISQNLTKSHHISSYLTKSHQMYQISMNLTESYKISPYITESHQISLILTKNLTKFHWISPYLTKTKCQSRTLCGTILWGDIFFKTLYLNMLQNISLIAVRDLCCNTFQTWMMLKNLTLGKF